MLKYWSPDTTVTFSEFPDEITLCVNISNCPGICENCSEAYLQEDIGEYLTKKEITKLIKANPGITCFGFMGGDIDHIYLKKLAKYIHKKFKLKVGFYSGNDFLDYKLIPFVDYYKIGRFIMPEGPENTWHKKACGPIIFPWSNQRMFKIFHSVHNVYVIDISWRMHKEINNLSNYIIK